MKTAEQIYDETYARLMSGTSTLRDIAVEAMKVYALQVSIESLQTCVDYVPGEYAFKVLSAPIITP